MLVLLFMYRDWYEQRIAMCSYQDQCSQREGLVVVDGNEETKNLDNTGMKGNNLPRGSPRKLTMHGTKFKKG